MNPDNGEGWWKHTALWMKLNWTSLWFEFMPWTKEMCFYEKHTLDNTCPKSVMSSGVSVWIERQLTLRLFYTLWYAVILGLSIELQRLLYTVGVCAWANCCHMLRVEGVTVSSLLLMSVTFICLQTCMCMKWQQYFVYSLSVIRSLAFCVILDLTSGDKGGTRKLQDSDRWTRQLQGLSTYTEKHKHFASSK